MILSKPVYEIEIEIKNSDGLHMRPAMQFVDVASKFNCDIKVSNKDTSVDAKSIMQMSMLAATCGTKLQVKANGPDASEAIEALRELVEKKLFDNAPKAGAGGSRETE
jgi:phosphocarrier protein HPr